MKQFTFKAEYEVVKVNDIELKVYYDVETLNAISKLDNKEDISIDDVENVFNTILGKEQYNLVKEMRLGIDQMVEFAEFLIKGVILPKLEEKKANEEL